MAGQLPANVQMQSDTKLCGGGYFQIIEHGFESPFKNLSK